MRPTKIGKFRLKINPETEVAIAFETAYDKERGRIVVYGRVFEWDVRGWVYTRHNRGLYRHSGRILVSCPVPFWTRIRLAFNFGSLCRGIDRLQSVLDHHSSYPYKLTRKPDRDEFFRLLTRPFRIDDNVG